MAQNQTKMAASAAPYNKLVLALYDFYVIQFSNRYVWQCPSSHMLDFYNRHIWTNHLDVGVGTGYFLDKCQIPSQTPLIALFDLNPNSLETTARRLQRYRPTTHVGDVWEPLNLRPPRFDSIALNYLLHCLAGDMTEKAAVFANLRPLLNPGGTVFGSTILGQGVHHNRLARKLMAVYNAKGIFGNVNDTAQGLEAALAANFQSYHIDIKGCVALFSATTWGT
ncbi:MAG: class I SAM-dependent methyltransferase [Caldilineaceae bacterium]